MRGHVTPRAIAERVLRWVKIYQCYDCGKWIFGCWPKKEPVQIVNMAYPNEGWVHFIAICDACWREHFCGGDYNAQR